MLYIKIKAWYFVWFWAEKLNFSLIFWLVCRYVWFLAINLYWWNFCVYFYAMVVNYCWCFVGVNLCCLKTDLFVGFWAEIEGFFEFFSSKLVSCCCMLFLCKKASSFVKSWVFLVAVVLWIWIFNIKGTFFLV